MWQETSLLCWDILSPLSEKLRTRRWTPGNLTGTWEQLTFLRFVNSAKLAVSISLQLRLNKNHQKVHYITWKSYTFHLCGGWSHVTRSMLANQQGGLPVAECPWDRPTVAAHHDNNADWQWQLVVTHNGIMAGGMENGLELCSEQRGENGAYPRTLQSLTRQTGKVGGPLSRRSATERKGSRSFSRLRPRKTLISMSSSLAKEGIT